MFTAAASGCVHRAFRGGPGHFQIQGLNTDGATFVQNVSAHKKDIAAAKACFNDDHRFYSFGKGFGNITATVDLYLGQVDGNGSGLSMESRLDSFFDSNRSSARSSPVVITSQSGVKYSFFLTSMRLVSSDPARNQLRFQLLGSLVE